MRDGECIAAGPKSAPTYDENGAELPFSLHVGIGRRGSLIFASKQASKLVSWLANRQAGRLAGRWPASQASKLASWPVS